MYRVQQLDDWTSRVLRPDGSEVFGDEGAGHESVANAAAAELNAVLARAAAAEAILRDMLDRDPCSHFDHHGYCQTHGWLTTDPPCPHKRARALLAASEPPPFATTFGDAIVEAAGRPSP